MFIHIIFLIEMTPVSFKFTLGKKTIIFYADLFQKKPHYSICQASTQKKYIAQNASCIKVTIIQIEFYNYQSHSLYSFPYAVKRNIFGKLSQTTNYTKRIATWCIKKFKKL